MNMNTPTFVRSGRSGLREHCESERGVRKCIFHHTLLSLVQLPFFFKLLIQLGPN